ncbi:MAG TPA: hypothetical protein VFR85_08250 [Anaeromyxobacteraceae bacterium]|nr:hypothetical protein [Anaeromyxobacteraceae bacterium]
MDPLWLLKGPPEAPGWKPLEADSRGNKIDLLLFDRAAWALVRAPEAPAQYPGLAPVPPPDGLYLDDQGRTVYVAGGREVRGPREVLATLGPQAQELLRTIGDPDTVLERLGRVY